MKKYLLELFIIPLAFLTVACGGGDSASTTTSAAVGSNCAASGLLNTSYGCMPQSWCQSGQALYNNQCVAVIADTSVGVAGTAPAQCANNTQGAPACAAGLVFVPARNSCLPYNATYCPPPVGHTCVGYDSSRNYCYYGIY